MSKKRPLSFLSWGKVRSQGDNSLFPPPHTSTWSNVNIKNIDCGRFLCLTCKVINLPCVFWRCSSKPYLALLAGLRRKTGCMKWRNWYMMRNYTRGCWDVKCYSPRPSLIAWNENRSVKASKNTEMGWDWLYAVVHYLPRIDRPFMRLN